MTTNSDFASGMASLRKWADGLLKKMTPGEVSLKLVQAHLILIEDFRIKHDIPGVTYWEVPETGGFFTLGPGESMAPAMQPFKPIPLRRHEYLARQGIHSPEDELL